MSFHAEAAWKLEHPPPSTNVVSGEWVIATDQAFGASLTAEGMVVHHHHVQQHTCMMSWTRCKLSNHRSNHL